MLLYLNEICIRERCVLLSSISSPVLLRNLQYLEGAHFTIPKPTIMTLNILIEAELLSLHILIEGKKYTENI